MRIPESWFPGRLTVLDPAECWELLARSETGRVAYCDAAGPIVLPVNHIVTAGDIVFRTEPQSMLGGLLPQRRVAYQVDEFDAFTRSGWSVLVRGTAASVDPTELTDDDTDPFPWVEGRRGLYVRIAPDEITGRRVIPT